MEDEEGECSKKKKKDGNSSKKKRNDGNSCKKDKKDGNSCSTCGKTYKNRQHVWRHEQTHTNVNVKQHQCLCGKGFIRKDHFQRHLLVCKGKQSDGFVCFKCNKSFTRKFNLQRHLPVCGTEKQSGRPKKHLVKSSLFKAKKKKSHLVSYPQLPHEEESLGQSYLFFSYVGELQSQHDEQLPSMVKLPHSDSIHFDIQSPA